MAVKEFSKSTFKNGDIGHFNLQSHSFTNLENQLQCTAQFVPRALRQLFFALAVSITPENISCVPIKQ